MKKTQSPAAQAPATPEPRPLKGKLGLLVELLQRPEGATIADMTAATAWQKHSVRGAMAGALKKAGVTITSQKADGVRVYRGAVAA